jgi:type III pantothenate kinase
MSNFDSIKVENIAFLDVGNSTFKLGQRKEDQWQIQWFKSAKVLGEALKVQDYEYMVTASVRATKDWADDIAQEIPVALLEVADVPKELLSYETPETLGIDRFLGCFGAHCLSDKPVVVIDCGSACTIDLMDGDGVFQGGVILPGVRALLQVFGIAAPALPTAEFLIPAKFPGKSSKASLQWGIAQFLVDGIRANLARYEAEIGDFELFVTGGDGELILPHIQQKAAFRPDLIFLGMEALIEL